MAQDEWTQFYERMTGETVRGPVEVGNMTYDGGFFGIRLQNNGHGPSLYIYGAGVDHAFVPQGAQSPYHAARVIPVNGEGIDGAVRAALAHAKTNPVKSKHD